ncbi:MAG: toll/interleukin-1 receptor domain-containing protein [Gemmatimonadota bacterium]
MPSRVFVSYSSADRKLARQIADDLGKSGSTVWLDEWELRAGHSLTQTIEHGLAEADFLVLLVTRTSLASRWVDKEWRAKLAFELQFRDVFVLPALADQSDLPAELQDRKYADFRTKYDLGIDELRRAIDEHMTARIRRRLPSDFKQIPFIRTLIEDFGIKREALIPLLRLLPPPDGFLSGLRSIVANESDADTIEILFYNRYDGRQDLWYAEQLVYRGIVK